jgi:putative ABC transport system permease protein
MRVTALDRKMLRDLAQMRGAAVAIALVMGCGVAAFVVLVSTLDSLRTALEEYYDDSSFPHVFVSLKRAPNSLAERLAAIDGVAQVETRIVRDVTLDVEGLDEPAAGRLISLPEHGAQRLSRIHPRLGRAPEPDRPDEVVAVESFARAHGLAPGARVRAVINGRRRDLAIVGTALSPEYVYAVREGEMLPDPLRFGIFWMPYRPLASAFDMDGAFNSAVLTVRRGAPIGGVIREVDRLTAPYGGLGAYGREDQTSNRFIASELEQLRSQAFVVPTIFLGVTAFLLQMVVSRLVGTQRGQIATLKAVGYPARQVAAHYLGMVALITLGGAAAGIVAGAALGRKVTGIYRTFYTFPALEYRLAGWIAATGLLIALGVAAAATLGAIRRATRVPPAEAMRPEPPSAYRPSVLERAGLARLVPVTLRMILRHLERRPVRSLMTLTGMSMAVAVLVSGNFVVDTLNYVIDFQFNRANRQTMTVALVEAAGARAIEEVRSMPGVRRAEPFRAVAARVGLGHRSRRVAIMGLEEGPSLSVLLQERGGPVALPEQGLLLSRKLAEILGARAGDLVRVEVLEGRRPAAMLPVSGLIDDLSGLNAYARIDQVWRLMREGPTVSGAHVLADPAAERALYRRLKETPRVASVNVLRASREAFEVIVAETLLTSRAVNLVFAVLIAIGVMYNSGRIALAERGRDLATLRVLGFTRGEAASILLGELGVLLAASLVPGLLIGRALSWMATLLLDTEVHRFPLIISGRTYALAVIVTLLAALGTAVAVRRRVDRLEPVAALKSIE